MAASSVPRAIPSAVAPSPSTSVAVDTEPQLTAYKAATGATSEVPAVPVSGQPEDAPSSPRFAGTASSGSPAESGGAGAPSVPAQTTALFRRGPADPHYLAEDQGGRNLYGKVNNPPTRGRVAWVKSYLNHVFNGKQNVDSAGWQQSSAQQRNSVMRMALPPAGDGYSPETYTPHQMPQTPRTQKFLPVTGNDPYGAGVLNRDTFGAGQTAGGQGGQLYSPAPGPPDTTSTAGQQPRASAMPVWG